MVCIDSFTNKIDLLRNRIKYEILLKICNWRNLFPIKINEMSDLLRSFLFDSIKIEKMLNRYNA